MNSLTISKKEKTYSLMDKASSYRNIHLAYLRTKSNYMNVELQNHHEIELFNKAVPYIYKKIKSILDREHDHKFKPLELLEKPKTKVDEKWETRPIVRIQFFDAVIIQSIINVLAEELRFMLPNTNFGYKLNVADSINMYQYWKQGYSKFVNKEIDLAENDRYPFVVEADIQNFYPSIDKELLLSEVKSVITINEGEAVFFEWVEKILNLEIVTVEGEVYQLEGLPQGPLYSPLLALFYIRKYLDKPTRKVPNIVGFSYVDDIRIYCETEVEANEVLNEINIFMEERGLKLNPNKSGIFDVDAQKKLETRIMGRASNLDRAIRDEIIVSSKDKEEMREKLTLLMKELNENYHTTVGKKEKLEERLGRFVDYRIVKLLDDDVEQWKNNLEEHTKIENLNSNFTAMWHALYLSATTYQQKKQFLEALSSLINQDALADLSYVKYIIHSYLLRWSPIELKYSNDKIIGLLSQYLDGKSPIMIKALLTNMHTDWVTYLKSIDHFNKENESEIANLLKSFNIIQYCTYDDYLHENRLFYEGSDQIQHTSNTFNIEENYLDSETFKNIKYTLFTNTNGKWSCNLDKKGKNHKEISLGEQEAREILFSLAKWIDIQFQFSNDRIPCSIVNPDYIYIEQNYMYLYGNPSYKEDIYYYFSPNKVWKESLIELIQVLFNLNLDKGIDFFSETKTISIWQYRIIKKLLHKSFNIRAFVEFVLEVILAENNDAPVSYDQIGLDKTLNHYIKDFKSQDKLFLISNFVESSWKNGAKECNLYTLHNHEHARYLINNIHEMLKKSDFSIYINSKEAFRLFAASYLHDIGMLSAPEEKMLMDSTRKDVKKLSLKVREVLQNPYSSEENEQGTKVLKLPYVYDIHSEVEKVREGIVRDKHPNVSEKELVTDYPKLPLSVAERRDIGIISSAHGEWKSNVDKINELLHDGSHPIRLKLLSLLLRLADLSDVSKERVRKEILERNHTRMDNESIYHWVKHLSVENLDITTIRSDVISEPTIVQLSINHIYLPIGNVEKDVLKEKCGRNCKFHLDDDGLKGGRLKGFYQEGKRNVLESNCSFKYFEDQNCNLTCAFVNKSYNWFFAEIIYLNMYLKRKNINVQFDLNIRLNEDSKRDFYYVYNRNEKYTAQEFMHEFFS